MQTFEVLPGLPAYGPPAILFSDASVGGHAEHYVVRFSPASGEPWIGNFVRGITSFYGVFAHPDAHRTVVISGGTVYIVDAATRSTVEKPFGNVTFAAPVENGSALLLEEGIWFRLLDRSGIKWQTRRLSWDDFRNVVVTASAISGEGWRYDETWHRFTVDLKTGIATGGAYDGPEV